VVLKEGFVRHDNYHDWVFFCLMPVALIAVPRPQRPLLGRSHLSISAFTVGTLCLAMLVTCKAGDYFPPSHIKGDAQSLVSDIKTLLSPSKLNRLIEQARPALRPSYDLPSSFLRQLRGQTVAIEPWENTVAWAFPGINWRPEPVLQQYSAYESSLDELDASFLLSADAPTRILVQPMQLYESDFSDPFLGAPAATVTRFCRYRQVGASANWQLLDRVRDRCGGLVPITMLKVAYGETVVVPAAAQGDAVVATFAGVGSSLRYRLENILLKAPEIQLQTPSGTYRFIAGTAPDLHMLRLPSTLGYSTEYCPPNISSFSLIDRNSSAGHYSVSFYELPMRP
jgi:hypothetical protein